MTHFSDKMRTGRAGTPTDASGASMPNGIPFSGGGIYGAPIDNFVVAIDTVPIKTFSSNLASPATISAANWTIIAGTGITTTTIAGSTYFDQGWDRSLIFTGNATTATATLITVTGRDVYLRPITCTFTGPVSTNVIETKKAIRYVAGAFTAGNTTAGVSIGSGDTFAFNHVCSAWGYIMGVNWSGNLVTSSAGFTVADVTSPATSATGDVRGTYTVKTISSDGVTRLIAFQYIPDPNTVSGIYGVTPA